MKTKTEATASSVLEEGMLRGSYKAVFSSCPLMGEQAKDRSENRFKWN